MYSIKLFLLLQSVVKFDFVCFSLLFCIQSSRAICIIFFMMIIFSNMVFLHWLTQTQDMYGNNLYEQSELSQHLLLKNGDAYVDSAQAQHNTITLVNDAVVDPFKHENASNDNNYICVFTCYVTIIV